MGIFRVEKNRGYTVMSNYHLKDKNISLKAKGLLSMILSLPDDWNYTTRGLAAISKEGVESIGTTLKELEKVGYLDRKRVRDDMGRIMDVEYTIYEQPKKKREKDKQEVKRKPDTGSSDTDSPDTGTSDTDSPDMGLPDTGNPDMDNPDMGGPYTGNPPQLNTNQSKTYRSNTNESNPNQSNLKKRSDSDAIDIKEYKRTRLNVQEQIDYESLVDGVNADILNEIVEIMTEILCKKKGFVSISGTNYGYDFAQERFKKINMHTIEYVLDSLRKTKTQIRNIHNYLITALFNAPVTIQNYYESEARNAGLI